MKSILLLLPLMMLLVSCASNGSWSENRDTLNDSALYDPSQIHLIDGVKYQFKEGTLQGRGQVFHSDFAFREMLIEQ
tara:strand:+ start:1344 stop:1574 length:231 start_codon:yes stop_codon:yes gene_type:complete